MGSEGTRRCRVYVVDDEQVIANTIAIIVRQHDFEAIPCFNADSAFQLMLEQAPDILLSDVVMPGTSGVELAVAVKKRFPHCKIVLFSGHINTAVLLEDVQRQGFRFECHTKPIYPERLLQMLGQLRCAD